jgi:hypothetical protein
MKNNKLLLVNEMAVRAYDITRECLKYSEEENVEKVLSLLDERERVINILENLSKDETLALNQELITQLNQVINKIQEQDDVILQKLASLKDKMHLEIAKVFKTKENFKGYNLNNLK